MKVLKILAQMGSSYLVGQNRRMPTLTYSPDPGRAKGDGGNPRASLKERLKTDQHDEAWRNVDAEAAADGSRRPRLSLP